VVGCFGGPKHVEEHKSTRLPGTRSSKRAPLGASSHWRRKCADVSRRSGSTFSTDNAGGYIGLLRFPAPTHRSRRQSTQTSAHLSADRPRAPSSLFRSDLSSRRVPNSPAPPPEARPLARDARSGPPSWARVDFRPLRAPRTCRDRASDRRRGMRCLRLLNPDRRLRDLE
jgi:hypothetical protein